MDFNELKSLKEVKSLVTGEEIRYVERPEIIVALSDYPNDPYFENQWTHKILESQKVFDITQGSEDIVIGISDLWISSPTYGVHEELQGRIPAYQSGKWVPGANNNYSHGPRIASIAAASNNNNGIASLGGSAKLVLANLGTSGLTFLRNQSTNLPDVINMSWCTSNSPTLENRVNELLDMGIVLVGATANSTDVNDYYLYCDQPTPDQPFTPYPASYNYPAFGFQVLSVTATQLTDDVWNFDPLEPPIDPFQYEERFRWQDIQGGEFIFNYSLDNDPINNPDSAFTDVAAPAGWIFTARGEYATETGSQNEYRGGGGATSEAAPLVTSIVAMMLSVNPALRGDPEAVYDILTSTTDYDNIVVPSASVTNTLPDGRKYNKYIGFGRVNAYEAVVAAVPKANNDINSATTWSGYIHLENTVNVYDDLTIQPGTTVLLDDNVSLIIRPGAKFIADGTESEPIRFIRGDADNDWNRISLLSSSGNSIKWALFDGGYINLSIASKNNAISHSTFRNATYRTLQGWHNQDGSGNASATITYSLIENSATVGFVAQYIDVDMSYTTIRDNNQAGLYIAAGTIDPFHNNLITYNGGSGRDGIEVKSSGSLNMHAPSYGNGKNEVSYNSDDQISSSGNLIVGTPFLPATGKNAIFGNYSGSRDLIANTSSGTIMAQGTWWGQPYVLTDMFSGGVNTDNLLTSNPVSSPGHNGSAPSKIQNTQQGPVNNEAIVNAYNTTESAIHEAKTERSIKEKLLYLYQLSSFSGIKELKAQFDIYILAASKGERKPYHKEGLNKAFSNYSKILYGKSLIRDENYQDAKRVLTETKASELSGADKGDWLHLNIVSQTYHRDYIQALETIKAYNDFQESQGTSREVYEAEHQTLKEDILMRIQDADGSVEKNFESSEINFDNELSLQNYPNPFNPTTNISFTLPVKGSVSLVIYDMLGRKVAILVDDKLPAGEQTFSFDASDLANGMYLYELRTANKVIVKKMTLIK